MAPAMVTAALIALLTLRKKGGLYCNSALFVYVRAHSAKARFSAPASFTFCTPLISAKLLPFSLAAYSICWRVTRICASVVASMTATVAAMIANAGHMSAGANWPTCTTYRSENTAVVPSDMTFDTMRSTSALAAALRLASSPAL